MQGTLHYFEILMEFTEFAREIHVAVGIPLLSL